MSYELAKDILTKELSADDDFDIVQCDFFGGEPFLAFNTIKEIVKYFRENKFSRKITFTASTNGTILSDEIRKWLIANEDIFAVSISFDGTKEMQDINRSNSFDLIDTHFFTKELRNGVGVKMTISQETLEHLAEGVIYCHSLEFRHIACTLACGIDWGKRGNKEVLRRELGKLVNYYIDHPTIKPCGLLDYHIENVAYPINGYAQKYCGAGTRLKVYDPKGICHPCQYFLHLAIGDRVDDTVGIIFSDTIPISELDKRCQTCIAVNVCPSCYGANYELTGNIYGRDSDFCELQKIIILANSYLKAKQWEMGALELSEVQEKALLDSILKIQSEFSEQ